MSPISSIVDGLVLLLRARVVQHIPKVILALLIKSVLLDEVVLVRQLEDYGKKAQQREHDVLVQSSLEDLDLRQVGLDEIRVVILSLEVGRELWNYILSRGLAHS